MLKNYFKTAWRNIRSQKLYSLINIGGLAVAMVAAVLIMLWGQNELRFDKFHTDADRIYMVANYDGHEKDQAGEVSPYPLYEAIRTSMPEVELIVHAQPTRYSMLTFNVNGNIFSDNNGLYADSNWFRLFHYDFIDGNANAFKNDPYSLVLTVSKARQFFGTETATGKTVQIDSVNYTVSGVLKDNPVNSSFRQDIFLPVAAKVNTAKKAKDEAYWGSYGYITFVKLRPGQNPVNSGKKITAIYAGHSVRPGKPFIRYSELLPLSDLHFFNGLRSSAFEHSNKTAVYIFGLLALLLLVTASINFVNLSVARAGLRSKEISVRKISGANRRQLFIQLMAEACLNSLISLGLTLLLIQLALPFFNRFTGMHFTFNPLDQQVALLLFGTLLSVILLTGIYPALLLSSFHPISLFNKKSIFGMRVPTLRRVLVTAQFVLAVVMITGAIIIYRQLAFIQKQDAGYRREQVFTIRLPYKKLKSLYPDNEQRSLAMQTIKNDLLANPAITSATRINFGSVINNHSERGAKIQWEGYPKEEEEKNVNEFEVDHDFNRIMNFQFQSGHWFDASASNQEDIILNEAAVRFFGLREPVTGTRFSSPGSNGTVIGVVKDFHFQSMHEKIAPLIISQDKYSFGNTFMIKTAAGKTPQGLAATEQLWKRNFPGEPFAANFLDEEFENMYSKDKKVLSFTLVFAGLSILLSCLGLLGMTVFAAQQRRKEIGIRKVLGASVAAIAVLLSKDFVKLVLIAAVIAFPLSYWAISRWLEDYAYRIPVNGLYFVIAAGIILLIAVATVSFQAIKAAFTNPADSLRTE